MNNALTPAVQQQPIALLPEHESILQQAEKSLSKSISSLVAAYANHQVTDQASADYAGVGVKTATLIEKTAEEAFGDIIAEAHKMHKGLTSRLAAFISGPSAKIDSPIVALKKRLKQQIFAYQAEQERKQREAAEKIRLEMQRQADEERLAAAVQAEKAGEKELAQSIIEQPAPYIPEVIQAKPAPVAGVSGRTIWKAQVDDLMKLVQAVAAGKVPLCAIQANDKFLGEQARSLTTAFNMPGVRAYSVKV